MIGLTKKQYLSVPRKRFDPITAFVAIALLAFVLANVVGYEDGSSNNLMFNDLRSLFFVAGGTLGVLLFQFDLETFIQTLFMALKSFFVNPLKDSNQLIQEMDEAILRGDSILSMRDGDEITGEMLNDIVHMIREKLFIEEIEDFINNRIASVFLARKVAVNLLDKGSKIAPALGLLGTVIGLIAVLQSLDDPSGIGPAMSLALMTTAFGSVLGSLVFTPLAGRLEHHNTLYLETHKQLMNRVTLLLRREDRQLDSKSMNKPMSPAP
jgi:chemotaxis protein MotA